MAVAFEPCPHSLEKIHLCTTENFKLKTQTPFPQSVHVLAILADVSSVERTTGSRQQTTPCAALWCRAKHGDVTPVPQIAVNIFPHDWNKVFTCAFRHRQLPWKIRTLLTQTWASKAGCILYGWMKHWYQKWRQMLGCVLCTGTTRYVFLLCELFEVFPLSCRGDGLESDRDRRDRSTRQSAEW